jgi:hypothetical protein
LVGLTIMKHDVEDIGTVEILEYDPFDNLGDLARSLKDKYDDVVRDNKRLEEELRISRRLVEETVLLLDAERIKVAKLNQDLIKNQEDANKCRAAEAALVQSKLDVINSRRAVKEQNDTICKMSDEHKELSRALGVERLKSAVSDARDRIPEVESNSNNSS